MIFFFAIKKYMLCWLYDGTLNVYDSNVKLEVVAKISYIGIMMLVFKVRRMVY